MHTCLSPSAATSATATASATRNNSSKKVKGKGKEKDKEKEKDGNVKERADVGVFADAAYMASVYNTYKKPPILGGLSVMTIFNEIYSGIQGHRDCFHKSGPGLGPELDRAAEPLSLEQYKALPNKDSAITSKAQRGAVYDFYAYYKRHKTQHGLWDFADLLFDLFQKMKCARGQKPLFQACFIDEVSQQFRHR
jgi:hypothetical protein